MVLKTLQQYHTNTLTTGGGQDTWHYTGTSQDAYTETVRDLPSSDPGQITAGGGQSHSTFWQKVKAESQFDVGTRVLYGLTNDLYIFGRTLRPASNSKFANVSPYRYYDLAGDGVTPEKRVMATTTVLSLPMAATGGGEVGEGLEQTSDAFTHPYDYAQRVRVRALADPVAHNFPYSFDDEILKASPIIQNDGSLLYRQMGTLNGKEGFYELGVNQKTELIFHRTFVGR